MSLFQQCHKTEQSKKKKKIYTEILKQKLPCDIYPIDTLYIHNTFFWKAAINVEFNLSFYFER